MNTNEKEVLLLESTLEVWNFATDTTESDGGVKFAATLGLGGTGWIPPVSLPPLEPRYGVGAFDMGANGVIDIPVEAGVSKVLVVVQQFQDGGIFKTPVKVSANGKRIGEHTATVMESPAIGHWNEHTTVYRTDEFIEGEIGSVRITAPANGAILTRVEVRSFPATLKTE